MIQASWLYQYFKIALCSLEYKMSVIPHSLGRNVTNDGMLLEKQTADNRLRPYKFEKYNKYTLERARMGRCADENSLAKAFFSQLEIASYWDSINRDIWLIAYIVAVM